jgi:hypothetical protein
MKNIGKPIRASAAVVLAFVAAAATIPGAAVAQYPDTYMLGKGVLRMSFEPSYMNWGERFDTSGVAVPLGSNLSFDSTTSTIFPSMSRVEALIWSETGDTSLGVKIGSGQFELDADVRRFPFNFRLGLHDRLTFTVSVPVVTTRMQVDFAHDTTGANGGWNQASPLSGQAASAIPQIVELLSQLESSASALEATINTGGFDCPNGPQCESARDLVSRARNLATSLTGITGVYADGQLMDLLPPFAPLGSSDAGNALVAKIQAISVEFQNLGAPSITGTLPLPSTIIDPDSSDIRAVLTEAGFGYEAQPLEFAKYRQKLGDIEIGLRYGLVQRPSIRAVLSTTVRLPTGTRDAPDHFVDIGTGDEQTDVEAGLDLALEPGSVVGIALSARYNLQLGDQLVRRITSPYNPIAPTWTESLVNRNLGDILAVAAYPTLRLNQAFRAYGAIHYYRKGSDAYSWADDGIHLESSITPGSLEIASSMSSVSVGAGIHFRSQGRDGLTLPAEAGVYYHAAYQGSGGFTPKTTGVTFYLRLFRRLFGGAPAEPEVEAEVPVGR